MKLLVAFLRVCTSNRLYTGGSPWSLAHCYLYLESTHGMLLTCDRSHCFAGHFWRNKLFFNLEWHHTIPSFFWLSSQLLLSFKKFLHTFRGFSCCCLPQLSYLPFPLSLVTSASLYLSNSCLLAFSYPLSILDIGYILQGTTPLLIKPLPIANSCGTYST